MDLHVVHDAREHLFVLRVEDDEMAGYVEYLPCGGAMAITHVVIEPQFAGKGYGARLTEAVLEEARERGLDVLPVCPFVRSYLARHPKHLALVPHEERARFGLAA